MTGLFNTNISALRGCANRGSAPRRGIGDTITRCIERAARRLGRSYTRTEDVWRGLTRRIDRSRWISSGHCADAAKGPPG